MEKKGSVNQDQEQKKRNALKTSISEGSAAKVTYGIGNNYITPLALALKGNTIHIGILSSLSGLFSQIAQNWGARMMENHSRKKILSKFILIEAIFWIPIALLGILYWQGFVQSTAIYVLIILYILLTISSGLAYPAWFSWMGDLVPENERGKYFSKRNLVTGIVEIATMFAGVVLIKLFEDRGYLLLGLSSFFIIAVVFRLISSLLITRQYEPKFMLRKKSEFSFWEFLKRNDNFGKFAVYQGFFNLAIMIASPFFTVYMAEQLKFSTATYMLINLSGSVFYLLFLPLVGKISDKYGNLKLLYLSNICFSLSPILWLISDSPIFLGVIPQISIGLANAALVIALSNFSYDSVSQEHRAQCISYSNILIGLGTFLGSIIGGLLLYYITIQSINIFIAVFILSALLRAACAFYFLPKLKEIRKVARLPPMSISLSHPFKSFHSEIGWINELARSRYAEGLKVWKDSTNYVLQKKIK